MATTLFRCEKCGGEVVVTALRTRDSDVHVVGARSISSSPVEAHVCVECGTISLYAQSPNALRPHREEEGKQYERGEIHSRRVPARKD